MKFDIPSKNIEDFCAIVFISRNINWHFSSVFFPLALVISLGMVKIDMKNVFWKVFFSRTLACHFISFFGFLSFAC